MKSFFATPRDQMAGMKLQHRNLYVPDTCPACGDEANQIHYCKCSVLRGAFWDPLLQLMQDVGMPAPADVTTFLAVGAISDTKAVSHHFAGMWFIAWRALYAELTGAHVDSRDLDIEVAYERTVRLLIGRLRAYGSKWRKWVETSRLRTRPNVIPRKHRNKKVLRQEADGDYAIHNAIWDEAKQIGLCQ